MILLPRKEMNLLCNMGKLSRKIVKLQFYLIIQPREIVILALTMKESLCKKPF